MSKMIYDNKNIVTQENFHMEADQEIFTIW